MSDIVLTLTSFPKRLNRLPDILKAWEEQMSMPIALYLSLAEYPNRENSIDKDVLHEFVKLNVNLHFRPGNEKGFKSFFAGIDYPNTWLLQTDDDMYPGPKSMEQYMELHNAHPNAFISCSKMKAIRGSGTLYNASMLDKRYLHDMPSAVPYILDDVWLEFWTRYAKIPIISGNIERVPIMELWSNGLTTGKDCSQMIRNIFSFMKTKYPAEYRMVRNDKGWL